MYLVGRLIIPALGISPGVVTAGFMLIWMMASVVLVLFGIFRVIVGAITKK